MLGLASWCSHFSSSFVDAPSPSIFVSGLGIWIGVVVNTSNGSVFEQNSRRGGNAPLFKRAAPPYIHMFVVAFSDSRDTIARWET